MASLLNRNRGGKVGVDDGMVEVVCHSGEGVSSLVVFRSAGAW